MYFIFPVLFHKNLNWTDIPGYQRRGDYRMLMEYAAQYGYEVEVLDKIQENGRDISSTPADKFLRLHTHNFFGERTLNHIINAFVLKEPLRIPTINLQPSLDKLLPENGVYVTKTEWKGNCYPGITNVGCKPTIQGENPVGVETHLFDFTEDLYGEEVRVCFLKHVRKEQKFSSLEEGCRLMVGIPSTAFPIFLP